MFIGFNLRAALTGVGPSGKHDSVTCTCLRVPLVLLRPFHCWLFAAMSLMVRQNLRKAGRGEDDPAFFSNHGCRTSGSFLSGDSGPVPGHGSGGHRHRLRQRASACHHQRKIPRESGGADQRLYGVYGALCQHFSGNQRAFGSPCRMEKLHGSVGDFGSDRHSVLAAFLYR